MSGRTLVKSCMVEGIYYLLDPIRDYQKEAARDSERFFFNSNRVHVVINTEDLIEARILGDFRKLLGSRDAIRRRIYIERVVWWVEKLIVISLSEKEKENLDFVAKKYGHKTQFGYPYRKIEGLNIPLPFCNSRFYILRPNNHK